MVNTTVTTRLSLLLHAAGLIFIYSCVLFGAPKTSTSERRTDTRSNCRLYGVLQEKIMKSSTYGTHCFRHLAALCSASD